MVYAYFFKEKGDTMTLIYTNPIFGFSITIFAFLLGLEIQKRLKLKFLSPMLTASVLVILYLFYMDVPYKDYQLGASILAFFIAPATIVLAVPLYRHIHLIKRYFLPIVLGCFTGIVVGSISGVLLCYAFDIDKNLLLAMLPKSVTMAIGYEISVRIHAVIEIAMLFIIVCGMIGYCLGEWVFKLLRMTDPIARGVALGTCSHVLGTAKAMELGDIEGAVATVSITIAGLIAVVFIPFLVELLSVVLS